MELALFLESGLLTDLTVVVGEEKECFKLHKLQICQHSGYFLRLAKSAGQAFLNTSSGDGPCSYFVDFKAKSKKVEEPPSHQGGSEEGRAWADEVAAFLRGEVRLNNLPGGSQAFRIVLAHCYGNAVDDDLTQCNVVAVHCAAVFLKVGLHITIFLLFMRL